MNGDPVRQAVGTLRIVHVTDNYPPTPGGLERAVEALATAQARRGHDVTVVTSFTGGAPPDEVSSGVRIRRLPLWLQRLPGAFANGHQVFLPPVPDPTFRRGFARVLHSVHADVVHVHGWALYSSLGPARAFGCPTVVSAHDYGAVCARKTLYRDGDVCAGPSWSCVGCAGRHYGPKGIPLAIGLRLAGRRHRDVDAWVAISASVASAGNGPPGHRGPDMAVIPSFVPDSVFDRSPGPRPAFVPESGPYFLYAGGLHRHKGAADLLAAHRLLWDGGVRVPLVVAGGNGDVVVDEPLGDGVLMVSDLAHEEIMDGWCHALAGVVPSAWAEPFGLVAVECLAAGTPVVACRVGALPDVVGEDCGILVPRRDPPALAGALSRLAANPGLARALGARGRIRARRFSLSEIEPRIENVYQQVLLRKPVGVPG
jgi:glycosyltransferase involved in cell wall biosynthesis